jgi:FKBP-type peptidyl-prolyl cis-trans isomerase FkpA
MRRKITRATRTPMLLILWIVPCQLFAQSPKLPSLKEQLDAQYAPGTVLVIQKEGILGAAPSSDKICPGKYQDGSLNSPEISCAAPLKGSSRLLAPGTKVQPSGIEVNLAHGEISIAIVEYDPCSEGTSPSYKAQIVFQFAKGYLEKGNVPEIEDTIGELLTVEGEVRRPEPAEDSQVHTNCDVVKMVKAKLGEGIITSTIKSSPCSFDLSVRGMVELKNAGVSDSVIQTMRDAQSAANAPNPADDQASAAPATNDQSSDGAAKTVGGLEYSDVKIGTGAVAQAGHRVKVNYTGWLSNGDEFDSSIGTGRPFGFLLGGGQVIKGWDEGIVGMKVGGKRHLVVPPDLAYGTAGYPPIIPPNSTLIFDVQLVDVK